jgi:predicted O-methyltransferase YrrM
MTLKEMELFAKEIIDKPDMRPLLLQILTRYVNMWDHHSMYYRFMFELARAIKLKVYFETGTRDGTSVAHIGMACEDAQALTIDNKRIAAEAVRPLQKHIPNIEIILGDSLKSVDQVKERLKGKIDLLFLDAMHTYEAVSQEYKLYSPLVREGGIILMDDINFNEGMQKAWSEIKEPKIELSHLHIVRNTGFGAIIKSMP